MKDRILNQSKIQVSSDCIKFYQNKTINGEDHCNLTRFKDVPELKQINFETLDDIWWQQDGAEVHRTIQVFKYLDGQFGARMMVMDSIQG